MAYIVTLFSADIRYGLNRAKLLSETDELTRLLNMRGFAISANRLFGQAVRYQRARLRNALQLDSIAALTRFAVREGLAEEEAASG